MAQHQFRAQTEDICPVRAAMTLSEFVEASAVLSTVLPDPMRSSGHHMGGCQNYGPLLGTLNNRCRIIIRTQKGTLILTTTHMLNSK